MEVYCEPEQGVILRGGESDGYDEERYFQAKDSFIFYIDDWCVNVGSFADDQILGQV